MKKIFIDLFSMSVSSNITRAISFFVFLIIMKELSVHDYGVLTLLFTIPSPLLLVSGLGISELVTSEIAKARGRKDYQRISRLFFEYYFIKIIIFSSLLLLAFILNNYLGEKYHFYLLQYFHYIIFYSIALLIIDFNSVILTSYEKFVSLSLINIVEPLIRLLILLFLYFGRGFDLKDVFLVYIISKVFSAIVGFLFGSNLLKNLFSIFHTGEKLTTFRLIKSDGKWLIINNFLFDTLNNIFPWLIKIFLNVEMVAIYGVATKIVGVVAGVMPIDKITFPLIAKNIDNRELVNKIITKARKYSLIISIFIFIMVLLLSGIVIKTFVPQYIQSIVLIKILAISVIISAIFVGQKSLFFAHNLQKFQLAFSFYSFLQNFILKIFFLYYFSLIGLAISTILHSLLTYIFSGLYLKKKLHYQKQKIIDYFKFDDYDRMIIKKVFNKIKL